MDDQNELIANIKQLVVGFAPHIRDARSLEEVHGAFLRMEEVDKNFHRYTFVKNLRSAIDDAVGGSIDAEIDRMDHNAPSVDQDAIVQDITSRVLKSGEYRELSKHIQDSVKHTCEYILTSGRKDFFLGDGTVDGATGGRDGSTDDRQAKSEIHFSDGDSSIGDTSLNHSTVIFMNINVQRRVAEGLRMSNSIDVRRDAIRELLQVTGFDVQNCNVWPQIREGLRDALLDADEELWMQTLRFIARGLSTNSACSREIYTTLVGFVHDQLKSIGPQMPPVSKGLSLNPAQTRKILLEFKLINTFQQMVPLYWQRYPEGCLEEILEPTLSLLAAAEPYEPSTGRFTPLHFVSLVDCKASWFVKSMHGQFSRAHLLKILEKHSCIVDNCVRSCLQYAAAIVKSSGSDDAGSRTLRLTESRPSLPRYSGPQVEFAYFTHALCILGRLILYEQGRKFFPIKFDDDDEPVTVTRLLVMLLRMVIHISRRGPPTVASATASTTAFDPCLLVIDVVKKLCSAEEVCCHTMCKDRIAEVLMSPIRDYIGSSNQDSISHVALSRVADILSALAMTQCGQQLLLYGEGHNWRSATDATSAAPVHILAKFAQSALRDLDDEKVKLRVVGSLVFVCRQLYSTTEGLLVLSRHRLHSAVASAWKTASREASTVTPTPSSLGRERPPVVVWEELLRDDLLNFAGTPKGVLLLQQTGAMCDCVEYMHSRYTRKLQVSKCEKFGYGYMMSQVAATAPGIVALHETGFTVTLIKSLWDVLEMLDNGQWVPKCWPVAPIDKQAKKPFTRIVNLLSSFRSVYEMLGSGSQGTSALVDSRQAPATVPDLLDRLVFVDSPAKIQSFFNYEDSHVFGLRLLTALTSCLDTCLLLQDRFKFQEMLMASQADNVVEDRSTDIILDMLSLERNHILVRTYLVGGPSERVLPPRTLALEKPDAFILPLFSSYPIPSAYVPPLPSRPSSKEDAGLAKFVSKTKKSDLQAAWPESAQKCLIAELAGNAYIDTAVLFQLLEQAVEVMAQNPAEAVFPNASGISVSDSSLKKVSLSSIQAQGISLSVRYGRYLQLLASAKDAEDRMALLLKRSNALLRQQQITFDPSSSSLRCLNPNNEVGFDWFLATAFLMTSGNAERAGKFLAKFSSLLASAFLWSQRVHCSALLPRAFVLSGISPTYSVTCHNIELVLQLDLPQVFSAFKMSGCSPAQVCQPWLNQCFWNYLDWPEIVQYISVCVLLGVDYQVYVCVAILRHLQRRLLQQMQDKNLLLFLREEPIHGFLISDHLTYMQRLEKKFRAVVLADMRAVLTEP